MKGCGSGVRYQSAGEVRHQGLFVVVYDRSGQEADFPLALSDVPSHRRWRSDHPSPTPGPSTTTIRVSTGGYDHLAGEDMGSAAFPNAD